MRCGPTEVQAPWDLDISKACPTTRLILGAGVNTHQLTNVNCSSKIQNAKFDPSKNNLHATKITH